MNSAILDLRRLEKPYDASLAKLRRLMVAGIPGFTCGFGFKDQTS